MSSGTMTGRRRKWAEMTPAERDAAKSESREKGKEKVAAAVARLDAAVEEIISSDESFREYLRCSAAMHSYSWRNRLMVYVQRPDARMVAGFNRWKELGRPVKKGAKGIQVLAPLVKTEDYGPDHAGLSTEHGKIGADGKLTRVFGFRIAYVFADRDTDGAPMDPPACTPVTDDSPESAALFERVVAAAEGFGVPFDVRTGSEDLGSGSDGKPAGWCTLGDKPKVVVNGDLPAAGRFKTGAHELAHALADHRANDDTRADCEAVAEGVAFVVAARYGMDTESYSAPYIAGWAGDPKRVRALLDRIGKLSGEMIARMDQAGPCHECGWNGEGEGGCESCR